MILAVLTLITAQPAAAGSLPPAPPVKASAVSEGDRIECRDEKPTGSHLIKTFCATRDRWEALHEQSMQNLYGFHQSNAHLPRNPEGTQFLDKK